jgi:hypothetical protein
VTGLGLTEIVPPTAIQNVRSRAVMTKLGTTYGHRLKLISPRRFCVPAVATFGFDVPPDCLGDYRTQARLPAGGGHGVVAAKLLHPRQDC